MIDYSTLHQLQDEPALAPWLAILPRQIDMVLREKGHGDLPRWQAAIEALPAITPSSHDFGGRVRIGEPADGDDARRTQLESGLRHLHPWRKGPYEVFGLHIDTEWRSDWKWDRLKRHIHSLQDRLVLDIGCGNGYHGWRMLGAGARRVIGIDPGLLYVMQYQALHRYLPHMPLHVLPLGIDDVPSALGAFDTVFSMGVLYHRRSPIDHLLQLRDCLRSGGELVLETLVVEGNAETVLLPEDRYARMRNVWFIPSCTALELWLKRAGFTDVRLLDVTPTTVEEQRATDWMHFESLSACLDPQDSGRTVEGYPAPCRAIFLARAS